MSTVSLDVPGPAVDTAGPGQGRRVAGGLCDAPHPVLRTRLRIGTPSSPKAGTAATALGLFHQNLFLQLDRFEADIGAALIHRTNHRYQPMTLTERGQQLLDHLNGTGAGQCPADLPEFQLVGGLVEQHRESPVVGPQ
jgi:hypothetical protein